MLNAQKNPIKPQFEVRKVRAALILQGKTIASFSREFGTSAVLVHQVISGRCPGNRPRSRAAAIRRRLQEVLA